jgi:transposase
MLTQEEDIDAHALRKQGWSITAIANHLGRDRKTIRAYLNGERTPGVRVSSTPDPFEEYATYCRERLSEDPHLWATTLFDEVIALGYLLSYQSFTRALRERQLRPACEPCRPAKGRPVAIIDHPAGEETQWDWLELPNPPGHWDGYRGKAFLLVGALSHSGKWRAVLCEADDQAHLLDAIHRVCIKLGGVTRDWRFDRMASVVYPSSGKVTTSFAAVAKHYGVHVVACPPRRGNRKGVVEKGNHSAAQRWWRTLPDDISVLDAEARLDAFCQDKGDARLRVVDEHGTKKTVGELAAAERLRPVPLEPYPVIVSVTRTVRPQALIAFRGNRYSVPPEVVGQTVTVSHRLGTTTLDVSVSRGSGAPVVLARHRRAADGAGVTIRTDSHVTALETAVLGAFTTAPPHRKKVRIPPGPAALAAAEQLRAAHPTPASPSTSTSTQTSAEVVIDLATYAAAAANRRTLP